MTEPLSLDDLAVMENGYGCGSIFDMRNPSRPVELNEDDLVELVKRLIHHEPDVISEPAEDDDDLPPLPFCPTCYGVGPCSSDWHDETGVPPAQPSISPAASVPADRVIDLMALLEASVAAAKDARRRHLPPTIDLPDPED